MYEKKGKRERKENGLIIMPSFLFVLLCSVCVFEQKIVTFHQANIYFGANGAVSKNEI